MKQQILDKLIELLNAAPNGLSAPGLQRRLHLSQPTLWRRLKALRSQGIMTVAGRGRATRYYSALRASLSALRSRRLHESVANRLAGNPGLREAARARLELLRRMNPHGRVYHDRWEQLIDGPLPRLLRAMTEDSEQADALRKESPLTILVDSEERRRVFKSVRAA